MSGCALTASPVCSCSVAWGAVCGPRRTRATMLRFRGLRWAELLKRTFDQDVLQCPSCGDRMKLIALVTEAKSIVRYLTKLGEPTDVPSRFAGRGPPYWKSTVLRRKAWA
jgi:hypothetical protein